MAKRALIGMSGGVDSSAAAVLMRRAGYTCVGATVKLYEADGTCGTDADVQDARAVAEKLGMEHAVFSHTDAFADEVIGRFITAYEEGRTPNPCVDCNRYVKFACLYRHAAQLGCDTVVTGHYARIERDAAGKYHLLKGKNTAKDQSYVLYFLTQEQLAHTVFPLGEIASKEEVRQIAAAHGLLNARKHDSQDICFIPDGRYADFIRARTGKTYPHGNFVDCQGNILGEHKGIIGYTVGQRRGLGLSLPAPLYVCRKCVERNEVVLAPETALYSRRLIAEQMNWIGGEPPVGGFRAAARTRYSAKEAPATVTPMPDGKAEICFDSPQRAITIGQAVVLYDGDEVIGGGTIAQTEESV